MAIVSLEASVKTERSPRLTGIDILRGVALLGVAIMHSGSSAPTTGWARELQHFSGFAVPFFLATSFYLASSKFYTTSTPYPFRSRLPRLFIPYTAWVLIYVLFACVKYWVSGRFGDLGEIFQDPISIIFFGGPGYHLYFIPLLLTGTFLLKGAEWLAKHNLQLSGLSLLIALSTFAYQVILITGNGFELGTNWAFQPLFFGLGVDVHSFPLLRVSSVAIAWIFRILPYILIALLLQYPLLRKHLQKLDNTHSRIIIIILFFIVNGLGDLILPEAVHELARGWLALMVGISLSTLFAENALIKNLGLCSFGIYLTHLIWVEIFKTVLGSIYPDLLTHVSVQTLFLFASPAWITSWITTAFLIKQKGIMSKLFFGI